MGLTHTEENYYTCMMGKSTMEKEGKEKVAVEAINNEECSCVGAGIGGRF